MVKQINLVHLYPHKMNIYGDNGNVLVLKKRLERRGFTAQVSLVELGDAIPSDTDIIVSGGGQDSGQTQVQQDILAKGDQLRSMSEDGVVMLTICGTYQLFGHRFITNQNEHIGGIGIFDMETVAGPERLIGNITIETEWGKAVGYENHSGLSTLADGQLPFGAVLAGAGNNQTDQTEGAVSHNTFGTYLHGPLLPKNPHVVDELIRRALVRKFGSAEIEPLDDSLAHKAHQIAQNRPR